MSKWLPFRLANTLDEAEVLADRKHSTDINSALLSCFSDGETMYCSTGDHNFKVETYQTISPIAIASTEDLANRALRTRVLKICMVCNPAFKKVRIPESEDPMFQEIRDMCYLFMMKSWKQVRENYQKATGVDSLSPREEDIFSALKAVTDVIDPAIFESMLPFVLEQKAAKKLDKQAGDLDLQLLYFLKSVAEEKGPAKKSNLDLCREFNDQTGYNIYPARFAERVRFHGIIDPDSVRLPHGRLHYDLVPQKIDAKIALLESKA